MEIKKDNGEKGPQERPIVERPDWLWDLSKSYMVARYKRDQAKAYIEYLEALVKEKGLAGVFRCKATPEERDECPTPCVLVGLNRQIAYCCDLQELHYINVER